MRSNNHRLYMEAQIKIYLSWKEIIIYISCYISFSFYSIPCYRALQFTLFPATMLRGQLVGVSRKRPRLKNSFRKGEQKIGGYCPIAYRDGNFEGDAFIYILAGKDVKIKRKRLWLTFEVVFDKCQFVVLSR